MTRDISSQLFLWTFFQVAPLGDFQGKNRWHPFCGSTCPCLKWQIPSEGASFAATWRPKGANKNVVALTCSYRMTKPPSKSRNEHVSNNLWFPGGAFLSNQPDTKKRPPKDKNKAHANGWVAFGVFSRKTFNRDFGATLNLFAISSQVPCECG